MASQITLTPASTYLLLTFVQDAPHWNWTPLLDELTPAQKGNLTDLKAKGLVQTDVDFDDQHAIWVYFTKAGAAFAKTNFGVDIPEGHLVD